MFNELFWPAGAALLLFWLLYREFRIAQLKLRVQGLQKSSHVCVGIAKSASDKYDAHVRKANEKELELYTTVSDLKYSLERITNSMIDMQKEKLQSTSGENGSKKISPIE